MGISDAFKDEMATLSKEELMEVTEAWMKFRGLVESAIFLINLAHLWELSDLASIPRAVLRKSYDEYLQTAHWQEKRKRALANAGWRCQLCNSDRALQVHHRTYERLGREHDMDLTVLCDRCHSRFHNK